MSTLFDIVGEFNSLYELAKSEDAQDKQAFDDTLESLSFELEDKAAGYAGVMARLEMEERYADEVAKKYAAIKTARKNARKKMADRLLYACDRLGVESIPAGDVTIKVIKNGGVAPLVIDGDVPDNMTKITIEPDNSKIRAYIKEHGECDFAHLEERGRHIEIV